MYKNNALKNHPLKQYFIPLLIIKLFGAIFAGLIYELYYGGGEWDTFTFHSTGKVIIEAFKNDISEGFQILFLKNGEYRPELMHHIAKFYSFYFKEESAFFIGKISAIIGMFTFNSYLTIACTFATFSFIGNWCILVTYKKAYPNMSKKVISALLYIPSVIFWGSGLFKDTISFACLGILFYLFYQLFVEKKKIISSSILIFISSYILFIVKEYVFLSLIPALAIMIYKNYASKIKNNFLKKIILPSILLLTITFTFVSLQNGMLNNQLDVQKTINSIQDMQVWHRQVSSENKVYSLGEYDPSIIGITKKVIPAIIVALFRPFIWEASGAMMLLSGLENLFFLYLFILLIFKVNFIKIYRYISSDPLLIFSFYFTILLGFIVGFTSYNFGALVRYKIPILPFFSASIFILLHKTKSHKA